MNGAHDMGGTHGFGPVEPELGLAGAGIHAMARVAVLRQDRLDVLVEGQRRRRGDRKGRDGKHGKGEAARHGDGDGDGGMETVAAGKTTPRCSRDEIASWERGRPRPHSIDPCGRGRRSQGQNQARIPFTTLAGNTPVSR